MRFAYDQLRNRALDIWIAGCKHISCFSPPPLQRPRQTCRSPQGPAGPRGTSSPPGPQQPKGGTHMPYLVEQRTEPSSRPRSTPTLAPSPRHVSTRARSASRRACWNGKKLSMAASRASCGARRTIPRASGSPSRRRAGPSSSGTARLAQAAPVKPSTSCAASSTRRRHALVLSRRDPVTQAPANDLRGPPTR